MTNLWIHAPNIYHQSKYFIWEEFQKMYLKIITFHNVNSPQDSTSHQQLPVLSLLTTEAFQESLTVFKFLPKKSHRPVVLLPKCFLFFSRFYVILLINDPINKQTDRHGSKDALLGGGNKYWNQQTTVTMSYSFTSLTLFSYPPHHYTHC